MEFLTEELLPKVSWLYPKMNIAPRKWNFSWAIFANSFWKLSIEFMATHLYLNSTCHVHLVHYLSYIQPGKHFQPRRKPFNRRPKARTPFFITSCSGAGIKDSCPKMNWGWGRGCPSHDVQGHYEMHYGIRLPCELQYTSENITFRNVRMRTVKRKIEASAANIMCNVSCKCSWREHETRHTECISLAVE